MHEINDVLKRSKFSNILSYLIYATGENEALAESYDSAIEKFAKQCFNWKQMKEILFCENLRQTPVF